MQSGSLYESSTKHTVLTINSFNNNDIQEQSLLSLAESTAKLLKWIFVLPEVGGSDWAY